tara:strand:- start:313 stop:1266 length:954 start_codon:yes stop_codon:yes gene_type:complete
MITNRKAIIFGLKGYYLYDNEKIFFKKNKPWGIILFSRNIKNIQQLKKLINQIKKNQKDKNFPILIDQEGGRVCRLNNIINLTYFSQEFFGKLYNLDKKLFYDLYNLYVDKVCSIFNYVGININTVPVLDVRRKKSHTIIGNRSFSKNPSHVSKLGSICVNLFKKNKIATVIKHIPGHGLATSDSHFKTPIIKTKKKVLIKNDFKPFKNNKSFFAMTAHIIYSSYDSKNTATHSKIIIQNIIRKHIKFKGLLISDDISMKSLKYSLEKNALLAIKSGCNLILHCNGKMNEMRRIAKVVPNIDKFTIKKTSHFYNFLI